MNRFDATLNEFYQDERTFPPFNPNRIVAQWPFSKVGGDYVESPLTKLPHCLEKQSSETNLLRRIQDFAKSAYFIWSSGNTVENGRGSVMIYETSNSHTDYWFAAFNRRDAWRLRTTEGVSRERVEQLLHSPV